MATLQAASGSRGGCRWGSVSRRTQQNSLERVQFEPETSSAEREAVCVNLALPSGLVDIFRSGPNCCASSEAKGSPRPASGGRRPFLPRMGHPGCVTQVCQGLRGRQGAGAAEGKAPGPDLHNGVQQPCSRLHFQLQFAPQCSQSTSVFRARRQRVRRGEQARCGDSGRRLLKRWAGAEHGLHQCVACLPHWRAGAVVNPLKLALGQACGAVPIAGVVVFREISPVNFACFSETSASSETCPAVVPQEDFVPCFIKDYNSICLIYGELRVEANALQAYGKACPTKPSTI